MACCFEVHNRKGSGFLEPDYQECLEIELERQQIAFPSQPSLTRLAVLDQTRSEFLVPNSTRW